MGGPGPSPAPALAVVLALLAALLLPGGPARPALAAAAPRPAAPRPAAVTRPSGRVLPAAPNPARTDVPHHLPQEYAGRPTLADAAGPGQAGGWGAATLGSGAALLCAAAAGVAGRRRRAQCGAAVAGWRPLPWGGGLSAAGPSPWCSSPLRAAEIDTEPSTPTPPEEGRPRAADALAWTGAYTLDDGEASEGEEAEADSEEEGEDEEEDWDDGVEVGQGEGGPDEPAAGEEGPPDAETLAAEMGRALATARATLQRQHTALEAERAKAAEAEAMGKRAQLLLSNLYRIGPGDTEVTVEDWDQGGETVTIRLNRAKYRTAKEECDELFAQARRLRHGSNVVVGLLDKNAQETRVVEEATARLQAATADPAALLALRQALGSLSIKGLTFSQPAPPNPASKPKPKSRARKASKPFRTFASPAGLPILVGRSRRENERLATREATGGDVWLHARGVPGAHVVVKAVNGRRPTEACLQLAANLAAFYSDYRDSPKCLITLAEPKHIIKPPNAPLGAVHLREELGTRMGLPAEVPDSAKEARAVSGQGEAFEGPRTRRLKKARAARAKAKAQAQAKQKEREREKARKGRGR